MKLFLFGNQLFDVEHIKKLEIDMHLKFESIILIESLGLSSKFKYHKIKIAFIWISMREYRHYLINKGYIVEYHDISKQKTLKEVINETKEIAIFEPADIKPLRVIKKLKSDSDLKIFPSPMFLTSILDFEEWAGDKKKYFFNSFYIWQRQRLNILIEKDMNPIGGKWSLDSQNQKKLPNSIIVPDTPYAARSKYFDEVEKLILKYFPNNPGSLNDFWLPTNQQEAQAWFDKFLNERFGDFGNYEDAITNKYEFVFHSAISPLLNIGLLTPSYIIKQAMNYAGKYDIGINNLEGFIRQIIGWREFVHLTYLKIGSDQKTMNFFNHQNILDESFYNATTGILPLDDSIKKVLKLGWSHHIERLMIIGNYMFLSEINPNNVYKWFMEMYVDAYEWVMIPNIYGMSQYADGGKIVTKPYFSSSNYVLKMSDYKKGEWCKTWDNKFWKFMYKNEKFLSTNPRLKMLINVRKKKVLDK